MKTDTGRCVVLFPHGVLFRDAESAIRKKMIEADIVDAVIGLGKNLFYNSSMESCLLVCRMKKPKERKGKIIFINAINELKLERSFAWLEPHNIKTIADTYWKYKDVDGFAKIVSMKDVLGSNGNLSLQLYVKPTEVANDYNSRDLIEEIKNTKQQINTSLESLFTHLKNIGI